MEHIGYVDAPPGADIQPTTELEYVITDDAGKVVETVAAVEDEREKERKANIRRAAELLNQIRAKQDLDKKMLRAAISLENLYVRKQKNRKRDKLAKASRKRNRKR